MKVLKSVLKLRIETVAMTGDLYVWKMYIYIKLWRNSKLKPIKYKVEEVRILKNDHIPAPMLKIGLCRKRGLVNANDSHLQQTWARVYTNFKSKPFDSQILKNSLRQSRYFPQQAKAVFDKVSDPDIKNYPGLISMLQRFQICIA